MGVSSSTEDRGLRKSDFSCIAAGGFGDPANSYLFSTAWHRGRLYAGTGRNILSLIGASPPPIDTRMERWPVPVPTDIYALDHRAEIWTYDPEQRTWEQAFKSPIIVGVDGRTVPRDMAYRGMSIAACNGDAPRLWVTGSSSNSRGRGTYMVTSDGRNGFESTGPVFGDRALTSIRSLVTFRDRLYMSPTGRGRAWNAAERPCVFESRDPTRDDWKPAGPPWFGDRSNDAIYTLAVFDDHLYAGTLNPHAGFQIWKTKATGRPPYRWTRVVDGGAGRGDLNECALSMCAFEDALYVGTGIANGGFDRTHGVGPAAAELIRIHPDDSWDLIVGEARMTPWGLKEPQAGLGAGFDNQFCAYVWQMAVHDGWLYAGTLDMLVCGLWRSPDMLPPQLDRRSLEQYVERLGGAELWRTSDGTKWAPVTTNGFGNPFNYGIRTLLSTPHGLFAGTANPFGPTIARMRAGGWTYEANPRGGAEVWLAR